MKITTVGEFLKFTMEMPGETEIVSKDSNFELKGAYTCRNINLSKLRELMNSLDVNTNLKDMENIGYDLRMTFDMDFRIEKRYMAKKKKLFIDAFDGTPYNMEVCVWNAIPIDNKKVICIY